MAADGPRWTTPTDIRTAALKAWNRGELLRELSEPTGAYPRRRSLRHPSATQLRTEYALAVAWAHSWDPAPRGCSVEYTAIGASTIGSNHLPCAAVFATAQQEIAFLGLGREAARFTELMAQVSAIDVRLRQWALARPLDLLKHGAHSVTAARVAVWLLANPRPGIYLRQLSLPGVHTKFVETHRRLIDTMLAVLMPDDIRAGKNYALRHGFLSAPERVRVRFLDPAQCPAQGLDDVELTAAAFSALAPAVDRIITTENLVNFLALPPLAGTLAVYGGGYGFAGLREAGWLQDRELLYWGDIDTHGFQILAQLRSHHPQVRSVLMDEATLLAHREFWGQEDSPTHAATAHLTESEQSLLTDLLRNTFGHQVRLEQEQLRWDFVLDRLSDSRQ